MTSDLFHQSHHFLIGKADFFKLEAVILFSSFLQQQSGVFIGVWVLPTRTNEQTGRQAGTLLSPLCTDSGCACCTLKSHIRRTRCFRFFQSREHFYFYFFRRTPVFLGENVRCKVKGKFFLNGYQVFVRICPLKNERGYFSDVPPIRKKLSVVV